MSKIKDAYFREQEHRKLQGETEDEDANAPDKENERLLSEQETREIACPIFETDGIVECGRCVMADTVGCGGIYDSKQIAIAQDHKTAAALIALIEQRFSDGHDKPLIQAGVQDWQDFKQSILEVKE